MRNQELGDYTQGVYEARESVMKRVTMQATSVKASGGGGHEDRAHRPPRRAERGLIRWFDVMGTRIVKPVGRDSSPLRRS